MWSARPFNSDSPDPFGRNQGVGERPLSAESAKCPSCGSSIVFRPEVRGMVCRNCGNIYNASTLEKMGSLGYTIEHDYTSDSEISDDDKKRHEIVCDSCGATMIADEHMMSTTCPFCGSPAIVSRMLTREFKPDYIIPFKIDRPTAEKNMKQWIKTRKMTQAGFKSKSRVTKMMAFYVPFWIVDCGVHSDMIGTGTNLGGSAAQESPSTTDICRASAPKSMTRARLRSWTGSLRGSTGFQLNSTRRSLKNTISMFRTAKRLSHG